MGILDGSEHEVKILCDLLVSGGQTFHTLNTEHVYSWLNMCKMFLFGASQLQLRHAQMRKDTRLSSLAMFIFRSEGVTE